MVDYIDIVKEDIPYEFSIQLDGLTYELTFDYNEIGDFFTVKLAYLDEVICIEKLVYGKPLFSEVIHKNSPKEIIIIPLSENGYKRISYDNFGEDILLYVVDPREEDGEDV